ncbi:MAG: aldo/keto reductase [Flaviflexus sp.]|nr:aldo/keto reductase [Flaviflexus sp.]
MIKRKLGGAGSLVSAVGLGTMTWGEDTPIDEARDQVTDLLNAGGSVIDTSPAFYGGRALGVLAEILSEQVSRQELHIISRAGLGEGPDSSRGGIERAVHHTLTVLGTDWIDTLVLAEPDLTTPLEVTADALASLAKRGEVHAIGLGNCPGWYAGTMTALLAERGVRPAAIHAEYHLLQRGIEREIIPCAAAHDLGIIAWSALGRGVLAGRYRHSIPADSRAASPHFAGWVQPYLDDRSRQVVEAIATAAEGLGCSIATVALAWVLSRPRVSCALVGPRTSAQFSAILDELDTEVPEAITAALSDVTEINLGYPEVF